MFSVLHSEFSPHWAWQFSKNNRKMLKPCISVVQLLSNVSCLPFIDNICCHCHRNFANLLDHCIHDCVYLNRPRAQFLQEISSLSTDIYMHLSMQDKQTQGGRTGLMVRASDSGSGDPGSILGRVGVFVSLSKRHLLPKSTGNTQE